MLGVLGISEFDEQVYRVFLTSPETPMQRIATTVDAPISRVRHAVARLESLGLIRRVGHGRYTPEGPHTALIGLLNQRRTEAEQAFSEVRGAVDELSDEYRSGRLLHEDPTSLVEIVSGRRQVRRRLAELVGSAATDLWMLDRPPSLAAITGSDEEQNATELAEMSALLARDVDVRRVYCPESMERPGRFDIVNRLAAAGERSRMVPKLPFRLWIIDRLLGVVPLLGNNDDAIAILQPSGLLDALGELFCGYWAKAAPLSEPTADSVRAPAADSPSRPVADDQPSDEDLALLRMLHAGLKDHAVARQLGVSERTATRRIGTIMARLGATTRFQAGVEAAKRGWL